MTISALLLAAGLIPSCFGQSPSPRLADYEQFLRLKAVVEEAFNADDVKKLLPYLSKDFMGRMITGDEVRSPAELERIFNKLKRVISKGEKKGAYKLSLHPEDYSIFNDQAAVRGRTEEEVVLGDGKVLKYQSEWTVSLSRVDGEWKIGALASKAKMKDKLTMAARAVALKIWSPWQVMAAPKGDPDWDQDGKRWKSLEL